MFIAMSDIFVTNRVSFVQIRSFESTVLEAKNVFNLVLIILV